MDWEAIRYRATSVAMPKRYFTEVTEDKRLHEYRLRIWHNGHTVVDRPAATFWKITNEVEQFFVTRGIG